MILVDTSVWIDHLHRSEPALCAALEADEVGTHPAVIEELALGSLADRDAFLDALARLAIFPALSHAELLFFVQSNRLWGMGLSPTDARLLGSVMISPGAALWTRDKRLMAVADAVGASVVRR